MTLLIFITFAKIIKPFIRNHYDNKKKTPEELRENKLLNRACREVPGFSEQLARFERNISVLGRSRKTYENYSRHVAAMALHFGCLPTELDGDQVQDYLYLLQRRPQTPSQSYFKHTVYGLRFLLKAKITAKTEKRRNDAHSRRVCSPVCAAHLAAGGCPNTMLRHIALYVEAGAAAPFANGSWL